MASTLVVMTTSIVTLITGFLLGVYSVKGYLISPELTKEARANYEDPLDSDETDIDEEATVLDHAPNWANGEEADRKQGLRLRKAAGGDNKKSKSKKLAGGNETPTGPTVEDTGEECKLVLVVRTDLGMTKGEHTYRCNSGFCFVDQQSQAKLQHSAPTQRWPAIRPSRARLARQAPPALQPECCLAGNVLGRPRSQCK